MEGKAPGKKTQSRKPGRWTDLFDGAWMDHICRAVRIAIVNVSLGERSMLHETLRREVLARLWEYVGDHWDGKKSTTTDVLAAFALIDRVEVLADRFEEGHPYDETVAAEVAAAIRLAWLEFIAHGAGPYLSWVVPNEYAQRVNAPKGKRRGWGLVITQTVVAEALARCGSNATYDKKIEAICDCALSRVPDGMRKPGGSPESTAKRALTAWEQKALKSPL